MAHAVWSHPLSKPSETWARVEGSRARARRAVWRNIVADGLADVVDNDMIGKEATLKKRMG